MFIIFAFLFCSVAFGSDFKITFGSCNDQKDPQPLWKPLIDEAPDLFIWGGDNIYADSKNPEVIRRAYELQDEVPLYQEFKKRTPIIGIWDDHDFSVNNSKGSYRLKAESQHHFLNFIGEEQNSLRREQEGIYTIYEFESKGRIIKVILLDNRYFKDQDPTYPLLGKKQWDWLEGDFKTSKADLHLIVSGLSILSPKVMFTEEWADYPTEVNRLKTILKDFKVKAPILVTGDKHFASIFSRDGLIEIMSSGMTHTVSKIFRPILARFYPNTFFGLNFGQIEVNWEAGSNNPEIKLNIKNRNSHSVIKKSLVWAIDSWEEGPSKE
jgi:alkaline phosphatase D